MYNESESIISLRFWFPANRESALFMENWLLQQMIRRERIMCYTKQRVIKKQLICCLISGSRWEIARNEPLQMIINNKLNWIAATVICDKKINTLYESQIGF